MKAFCTWVLICLAAVKGYSQYLFCTDIPFQYKSDSISFGSSNNADLGDSMMVIPIINLSDTAFFKLSAKLIAVTALPGGTSIINGNGWSPFAAVLGPRQTAYAHFYFKVDSLIYPESTTGFQLWINNPGKSGFDSCVFDTSFKVNMNAQIVPQVFSENSDDVMLVYPVPAFNVLHIDFKSDEQVNSVISISDISGKKLKEQEVNVKNWDIDVSSLAPGIYMMQVICNGRFSCTKSIVIQR